jgi:PAP2 superfamily protein
MTALETQDTGAVRTEPAQAHWWRAARLWAVALSFFAVGVVRSVQVGIPFRDPHGAWLVSRLEYTAVIFTALVALEGVVRSGRPFSVRRVASTIGARWTPTRLALAWSALLAYLLTYVTYRNLKSWNDLRAPHDDLLQSWDRWLFLGHSPAVLLHDVLGQHAAAWVLAAWYGAFPNLVLVAFPAAVVLAPQMRDAFVGIAAFIWVWILGTATYYAIPSLGPFHAAPGDFTGLPHMSVQDTQARYLEQRAHLIAHPMAGDAYAQVAAFASLHVGVSAVIVGLAWWHGLRRTALLLGVFLAGTAVATVYLGWHFVVDLPAGLAIAALAWWLGPRTVGVTRRPGYATR